MAIIQTGSTYTMDSDITVFKTKLGGYVEPHTHRFAELVYILNGKCTHIIDGKEYPVSRGNLLFINYNKTHSIAYNAECEYFNILIKPEFISENLSEPENAFALLKLSAFEDFQKIVNENNCVISFSGSERTKAERIIFDLEAELETKNPGYRMALKSGLNLLLIMIFRKMALPLEPSFAGISNELLEYIRVHCGEKLTLENLAGQCFYSPSYFSRVFRLYTGMTLTEYLKTVRVDAACRLLETTDMKITDIFVEVGYADKTRFFKDFRQLKGVSPKEYKISKK